MVVTWSYLKSKLTSMIHISCGLLVTPLICSCRYPDVTLSCYFDPLTNLLLSFQRKQRMVLLLASFYLLHVMIQLYGYIVYPVSVATVWCGGNAGGML